MFFVGSSLAEQRTEKSALPFGRARKNRPLSRKVSGSRGSPDVATDVGPSGTSTGAGAAQFVDCLLQAGLLVRHQMGAVEVMRLTAPGAGSVVSSLLLIYSLCFSEVVTTIISHIFT